MQNYINQEDPILKVSDHYKVNNVCHEYLKPTSNPFRNIENEISSKGINNNFYLFDPVMTGNKRYRDEVYNFSPNISIGGIRPFTPNINGTPLNIPMSYFMFNNINNDTIIQKDENQSIVLVPTPNVSNLGFYNWVMQGTPILKEKKNIKLKKRNYKDESY